MLKKLSYAFEMVKDFVFLGPTTISASATVSSRIDNPRFSSYEQLPPILKKQACLLIFIFFGNVAFLFNNTAGRVVMPSFFFFYLPATLKLTPVPWCALVQFALQGSLKNSDMSSAMGFMSKSP